MLKFAWGGEALPVKEFQCASHLSYEHLKNFHRCQIAAASDLQKRAIFPSDIFYLFYMNKSQNAMSMYAIIRHQKSPQQ